MELMYIINGLVIGAILVSTVLSTYLWKKNIERPVNSAFTFLGIAISCYLFFTVINYKNCDTGIFIKLDMAANYSLIVCGITLIIFLRNLTGYFHKKLFITSIALLLLLAVLNFIQPLGLSYARVDALKLQQLPWGEQIHVPQAEASRGQYVVILLIFVLLISSIKSLRFYYRNKAYTGIRWLELGIIAGLGVLLIDNLLIINGYYHLFFMDSISFLFFILLFYHRNLNVILNAAKIQKNLNENEKITKLILESTHDGILDWDLHVNTVEYNSRFLEIVGYTRPDELKDWNQWLKLVHPDDQKKLTDGLNKFMESGKREIATEYRVHSAWDTWLWIQGTLFVAAVDKNGRPTRLIGSISDITERKNAEEKLRRSETRFRLLSQASFEGIAIARNHEIVDLNQQLLDMFGYQREDLIGISIAHLIIGYSRESFLDTLFARRNAPLEFEGVRKDGAAFPVEIRSRLMPQGDDILNVCIIRDLTAVKNAKRALEISARNFRMLFEASPLANIVVAQNGSYEILTINEAGKKLFRQTVEKEPLKDITSLFGVDAANIIIEKLVQNAVEEAFEVSFFTTGNKQTTVLVSAGKVSFNGIASYLLILDDISDIRAAENDLNNSLHYIDRLINALPMGLISVNKALQVSIFNQSALRFTAGTENLVHENLFEKFPKLSLIRHKIEEAMENPNSSVEATLYLDNTASNTGMGIVQIIVIPLQLQSDPVYALIIEDITAKRNMEEAMIQGEKLRSIAGLAAGMAHEINNPLGTIAQGCQNLERRISPAVAKNREAALRAGGTIEVIQGYFKERQLFDIVDSMREATNRASDIIKSMLEFSRKNELVKTAQDINQLIDKALDLANSDFDLRKRYDFRLVQITKQYSENLPVVAVNNTEIEQVLLNLIKNAAQEFARMPVKNSAPEIILRTYQDSGFVIIDVQDNGPGIPDTILSRIFEPFFTTKEVGEGTGLGLAVAYMIVENNHHGSLSVTSRLGEGSTFSIRLPKSIQLVTDDSDIRSV